jgi:hypothetical protein
MRSSRSERSMMGLGRVELPTSPLSGVRSNHLSYRPECLSSRNQTRISFSINNNVKKQFVWALVQIHSITR